jgi:enoyl-CoA hydratase/carnithine racemase
MAEGEQAGTTPLLSYDGLGGATITLNRPRHLNRLHREDLLALQAHIATLAADDTLRVVVLTGTGRAFCAGFNLDELAQADAAGADPRLFEHTVDALEALAVPTIARLNGGVFGGATDLALACDFRVGVQGMELRMPAAAIGLHYYASGLRRYVSRLGLSAAKRLFLLAQTVPAEQLLTLGYLDQLVPPEALDDAVDVLASALRAHAPLALRGMKASLNEIAQGSADEALLRGREARCAASADLREGLAALAARRPPRFTGR